MWLLFAVLAFVLNRQLKAVNETITDFTERVEPLNMSVREMEISLVQMTTQLRGYLLDHNHEHLEQLTGDSAELGNHLRRHQQLVRAMHNGMSDSRLDEGFQQLVTLVGALLEIEEKGHKQALAVQHSMQELDTLLRTGLEPLADRLASGSRVKRDGALHLQMLATATVRGMEEFLLFENRAQDEAFEASITAFEQEVAAYRATGLAPQEAEVLGRVEVLFQGARSLMRDAIEVKKSRSRGLADIVDTRRRLENILDDEIQLQSRRLEAGKISMRAALERIIAWKLGLLTAAMAVAFGVALVLGRSIGRPLLHLVEVTRRIRQGDWSARVEVGGNDEFRSLGEAFNEMIVARKEAEAGLKAAREELEQRVAERTADMVEANLALKNENYARRLTEEQLRTSKERAEKAQRDTQVMNAELEASVNRARHLTELAQAASHAKSQFLATISHELRTPINGILGFTNLLLEGGVTEEQRDSLTTVRDCSEDLLRVVNNILDYSNLEAGRINLIPQAFLLRPRLTETLRLLTPAAEKQGLQLRLQVEPGVPDSLVGDPQRLHQILINLLGNGIKFTQRGSVGLEVALLSSPPLNAPGASPAPQEASPVREGIVVRFTVRDSGMGIPVEKQDQLFNAFTQLDGSSTREFGGTGLGLAICRELIELMGGRIWLESQLGVGSTFHFTILFQPGPPVPPPARTTGTPGAESKGPPPQPQGGTLSA
ncbi:MAG TPA: hypothetical protein DCM86_06470 [Verrucomicrobiales bacterium]|nr:hypothetical protein [Verrucomicrobiales bacterium]